MTERVNRTWKPIMAIFAQSRPKSWDKEIQKVTFAVRTSINETTGEIPAFMMFGRNPKLPLGLMVGEPVSSPPSRTMKIAEIDEYKENLIHNLRYTYEIVREHSEIEKLRRKMKYDQHTSQRQFGIGDLVSVANTSPHIGESSISRKLQPKYQGPCRLN